MIKKEILFFIILPLVLSAVSATSWGDAMELYLNQKINERNLKQLDSDRDAESSRVEADDRKESYKAFTPPITNDEKLIRWLNDEKVDKLIHHLEALEKINQENDEQPRNSNFDSEEFSANDKEEPRSEVRIAIQKCGVGKVCIGPVQLQKFNQETAVKIEDIQSSADDNEPTVDVSNSASSYERSSEPEELLSKTAITHDITSDDISEDQSVSNKDERYGEWIPLELFNKVKNLNQDIINNKKFAKIGPIIFEDNIPKLKDSNEYNVKDIKQLIVTKSEHEEPKGIIVAEDRKFSLDYINLDDLRSINEETVNRAHLRNKKSAASKKQKRNNKRQRTTTKNNKIANSKDRFPKSTKKKILRMNEFDASIPGEDEKVTAHDTEEISPRTIAQKRKKQKALEKQLVREAEENKKKKAIARQLELDRNKSWGDSDSSNSNDDDDNDSSPKKPAAESGWSKESVADSNSDSPEVPTKSSDYMPKRFKIAKSPTHKRKKKSKTPKKKVSSYTPKFSSTETGESLSEEVTVKKHNKKRKSKIRVPGKPDYYMQSYGRVYEEGEDFRKRLPQFLPKRYHWDPVDDFHHLGYLWFNGYQGMNPPGNFKIAY